MLKKKRFVLLILLIVQVNQNRRLTENRCLPSRYLVSYDLDQILVDSSSEPFTML